MNQPAYKKSLPKRLLRYFVIGGIAAVSVTFFFKKEQKVKHPREYREIAAEGVLRAVTEYNSLSFFVDGDTISGFHYELIEAFARNRGWAVTVTPEMSFDMRLKGLAEGKYDIIAHGILATSKLKDSLLLTSPIILNKEVLIQRKPLHERDSLFVRNQLDLAGKTVHVVKGAPSILRIHNLGSEIGDTIYIREVAQYGPEQLIAMVAHGDIDYAVCDESIARAVADSFPQIDFQTYISFTQFSSWAVSKQSPVLLDSLNAWLETFRQGKEYSRIYQKYYGKTNPAKSSLMPQ